MAQSDVAYQITVDGTTLAVEGIRGYFQSPRAGLDAHLATRLTAFIDDAHDTIDCAIYDLRHPLILAALARAVERGLRVRIAYDAGREHSSGLSADPRPSGVETALTNAGLLPCSIPIHEHGRHLMHDKFIVRDGRDVWVGSANFTEGGLELQDNTCLTISSPELAARFSATFAHLIQPQHRHTMASLSVTAASSVTVGSTAILPLFAPEAGESLERELVSAIQGARKIRLTAFLLSDPGILQAMAPLARQPQFDIRGVYDPHGMEDVLRYTQLDPALFWFLRDPRFVAAPSHPFAPDHEQDFMHNKTLVIDDQLVFTGSYNFSENAEANDEVLLRIESEPIAIAYAHYCDVLFAAYGGVIEEPRRRSQPWSQPRSQPNPHSGGPRPRVVTAPPMSRITSPGLRVVTPPPAFPPRLQAALAATPHEKAEEADDERQARRSTRTLDILINIVMVKIVAVVIFIVVYLIASGILRI